MRLLVLWMEFVLYNAFIQNMNPFIIHKPNGGIRLEVVSLTNMYNK
jgi:hypothetical protein